MEAGQVPRGRGRQERPDRIRGRQLRRPGHRPLRPRWQGARASQRMVRRLTGLQGLRDSRFVMQEEPRAEAVTEAVAQAAVMKTGLAQDGMPAGAEMAAGGPDIAQAEMEAAVPAAMAVETEEAGTEAVAPVAMAAIVTEQVETEIVDLEQALPEARAALAVPAQARPVPASGIPAPEALTHRFRQSPPTTVRIRTATKMIVTTERM